MLRLSLQGWQSLRTWSWILRVAERLGKIFFWGAKTIAIVEKGEHDPVPVIVKSECSIISSFTWTCAYDVLSLQASTASYERTFFSMNFFHSNFREIAWGMRRSLYLCEHSVNWEKAQKGAMLPGHYEFKKRPTHYELWKTRIMNSLNSLHYSLFIMAIEHQWVSGVGRGSSSSRQ